MNETSLQATELTASLTADDVNASLAWYRDILGFEVTREHRRDDELRAVSLKAGTVRLLIGQDNWEKGRTRVKGEGFSLMLTVLQDIDQLAASIRSSGGTLESEPADTPWGTRAFRIVDPTGFRWTITS